MNINSLRGDLAGGLSAALVSLPQSIAMGVVAFAPLGVDFIGAGILAGVYGAILLTAVSGAFGGTPGLISGPRASVALVIAGVASQILNTDTLTPLMEDGPTIALSAVLITLFLAAALQLCFGLSRLGSFIRYMPYPVIAGFLNAAACLVILNQLHTILDIPSAQSLNLAFDHFDNDSIARAALALLTVSAVLLAPRVAPRVPALFVGLLTGMLCYELMIAAGVSFGVNATLPHMPPLQPATEMFTVIGRLIVADGVSGLLIIIVPAAISIAFLQSFDSLFSSIALDNLTQNRSQVDRELTAQGLGGMLTAVLGLFGGSGSLARTMPSYSAGGRTSIAALSSAGMMLLIVSTLGAFVEYVPKAVIAGLLLVIGLQLFDKWSLGLLRKLQWGHIWAAQRIILVDLGIIALVVATALIFSLVLAVGLGLVVAIIDFLFRMSLSPVRRTISGDGLGARVSGRLHRTAQGGRLIAKVDLHGALFFGSIGKVEQEVEQLSAAGAQYVLLDMKRVLSIDSTAARTLMRMNRHLRSHNKRLLFSYIPREKRVQRRAGFGPERRQNSSVRHQWMKLQFLGAIEDIGEENFFMDSERALCYCDALLLRDTFTHPQNENRSSNTLPSFLHGFERSEIRLLRRHCARQQFEPGETVFHQGDISDAAYVLVRGQVEVNISLADSERSVRIHTLNSGDVFGEMAILDPKPRSASIIVSEPSVCYRINKEALAKLLVDDPEVAFNILRNLGLVLTHRLRSANLAIMELEQ